ncbi:MAG: tetratricopeptide repeat protein [Candidatus Riflebacteria bacterium]|nr:tetratricopeptide repeat protein [Candidatus Riflebacteria bacterium]
MEHHRPDRLSVRLLLCATLVSVLGAGRLTAQIEGEALPAPQRFEPRAAPGHPSILEQDLLCVSTVTGDVKIDKNLLSPETRKNVELIEELTELLRKLNRQAAEQAGTPQPPDDTSTPPPPTTGGSPRPTEPPPVVPPVPGPALPTIQTCTDATTLVKMMRQETQKKYVPILELMGAGERALRNRYFEDAISSFEAATEVTTDLEQKWHKVVNDLLASVSVEERFQAGCVRALSASLSMAVVMRDLLTKIYPRLGRGYRALGKHEQAAALFGKSVAIDPSNAKVWALFGEAMLGAQEYKKALEALRVSVRLDGYQPEVYYLSAKACAKTGESRRALYYLRRAISKGYNKFAIIERDPDLTTLHGDPGFEEIVYMAPSVPY